MIVDEVDDFQLNSTSSWVNYVPASALAHLRSLISATARDTYTVLVSFLDPRAQLEVSCVFKRPHDLVDLKINFPCSFLSKFFTNLALSTKLISFAIAGNFVPLSLSWRFLLPSKR